MNLLGQSAFLRALGWALLNSMWQFGLLWLILTIFINTQKKTSPLLKHGIALFLMTVGFVCFIAELFKRYFLVPEPEPVKDAGYLMTNDVYSTFYLSADKFLENNVSYFSFVYLIVVTILSVRFLKYLGYIKTIQSKGLSKLNVELRLYVQRLVEQLGIRRKVQVWVSEYIDTPMVMGLLKPTILIPFACINQLSIKQMEAILLHELAHIKRNDYLVNLYVATVEILFFFNPFARLLIQSIKQERENSCDDWVLQFRFDKYQYASALLALEKNRSTYYPLSVAATGGNSRILLKRIQRIMGVKGIDNKKNFKFLGYVFTVFLLGSIAFVHPDNVVIKKMTRISGSNPINKPFVKDNLPVNLYVNNVADRNMYHTVKSFDTRNGIFAAKAPAPPDVNLQDDDSYPEFTVETALHDQIEPVGNLTAALNVEVREFSLPEKPAPELPVDAIAATFPYVPASSFTHLYVEDTAKPKDKIDSYKEHTARESLAKARKAIECLDWNKIESLLKNNVDILKLRTEIQQSLEELNWQKIDEEVAETVNKEAVSKMKHTLKAEYDHAKQYKDQLTEYQKIQNQLQLKQEKYKKDAEIKLSEIQKQSQKIKAIVII